MVSGIEHFGLAARDVRKLAQWYCDTFGMKVIQETPGGAVFIRAQNGVAVEVYAARGDSTPADYHAAGWRHVAVLVQDIEAERSRLASLGVDVDASITDSGTFKIVRFRDPEGNHGHLVERAKPL